MMRLSMTTQIAAMLLAARLSGNSNIVDDRRALVDDCVKLAAYLETRAREIEEKEVLDGL